MDKYVSFQTCEEHYNKGSRDSSEGYLIKGLPEEGAFNQYLRVSVGLGLMKGCFGGREECFWLKWKLTQSLKGLPTPQGLQHLYAIGI